MAEIQNLIQTIVTGLRLIAGVVAVGCLIWSGILWMTAAGNPRQIETARSAFVGAFVGFAIAAGADQLKGVITGVLGGG